MARGCTLGDGQVVLCKDRAASDHDGVAAPFGTHAGGGARRASWGPRKLRPPHQVKSILDITPPRKNDPHTAIAAVAKAITVPGSGHNSFTESRQLKHPQTGTKCTPRGASRALWKEVANKVHKREHKAWHKQQAEQAAQLDWRAMRTIQRGQTHRGWHLQLQDDPDWQQHLSKQPQPDGGRRVAVLREQLRRAWRPFTQAELQQTSHTWANNKSTGPDGISHEAARALLAHPVWGERLLYVLNDLLYTANIPSPIDRGITVLLPKVSAPLEWGETRPITLSSGRGGHQIRHGATLQWARKGRQGIELIATLRRVTTMARDWGVGTYIVKLDIRKAFDSVWQHSMSELVAARVGGVASARCPVPPEEGDQPWEALLWLSILQTRGLNVAVGDTITTVPQTNGIRQGSPDSPDLFGAIVARDLQTAINAAPPQGPDPKGGRPPPRTGGSFLDDTYLSTQSRDHLQHVLTTLEAELDTDGLQIHPTKTAILYSKPEGGGTFTIGGSEVACAPHKTHIGALGSPITFARTVRIAREETQPGQRHDDTP
eukprot:s2522_g8.t1